MKHNSSSRPEHAYSRYMCVTMGVIEKLQQDYFAARDLGRSIPGMDETVAATIVAESLQADRLWETLPERLSGEYTPEPLSDWGLATLAELFFVAAVEAWERKDKERRDNLQAMAMACLEQALNSSIASPMLWYEDIFFEVGQELRMKGERRAVEFLKRALAHDLRHHEGNNADMLLKELAETWLWVDELDAGLMILAALLRNDPGDVWIYNLMAITFDDFGLTEVGTQAARRGLELVDSTGDPEKLHDQLLRSLDDLQQSERHGREAEVTPDVLADLRAALALDFDAGERRPAIELCRELVSDLDQVPVKRPPEKPDLQPIRLVQQRPSRKLKRNDPCWCGSGRKYKRCHMRADQKYESPMRERKV
jgi:tetratricopeptide (TPR) repeat protein